MATDWSRVSGSSLKCDSEARSALRRDCGFPRDVWFTVHAAGDAAGLNGDGQERVGLHDLRHSYVAIALASGVSIAEASKMVKHRNAHITATIYAGLTEDAREAAEGKQTAIGFGA